MSTKIIVLNGPKSSGKDMLGDYLAAIFDDVVVKSFKSELLEDTIEHFGVSPEWFYAVYDNRVSKEQPLVELGGKSPREALIYVSEDIKKPLYGNQYYGDSLVGSIDRGFINVITDGGVANFTDTVNKTGEHWAEIIPIVEEFGEDNILIIQLMRDNCSFEGDSRRYFGQCNMTPRIIGSPCKFSDENLPFNTPVLSTEVLDIDCVEVHNNGSVDTLLAQVESIIEDFKIGVLT
jgi:hypothetical protein